MRALTLASLALALLACRQAPAVREDRVRFSHGPHLRAGQTCLQCHEGLTSQPGAGATARSGALPSEASCQRCHTRPEERACGFCHTEPRNPGGYPRRDRALVFSHPSHVTRERGGCVTCHGMQADPRTVQRFEPSIPTMDGCASRCHAEDLRSLRCARCHQDLGRYALEELAVVRHGPGFARSHGPQARAEGGLCAQCHAPTFCARCHNPSAGAPLADFELLGVARDFVHRGDFQARHAEEARLTQNTCTRCHGAEACNDCHRARGIGGGVGPGATHPPGWLDPLSPRNHGREARRNILGCASCHETDAAQVCTPCHREGGAAGNPHPPGFAAGFDRRTHSVCLVCHSQGP
ncbi:MAG: hypothetical protein HY909_06220 [Deltaproteobacteria bacterium]|nr:hypothetical protein [Deltaproteobacteria bacterium]